MLREISEDHPDLVSLNKLIRVYNESVKKDSDRPDFSSLQEIQTLATLLQARYLNYLVAFSDYDAISLEPLLNFNQVEQELQSLGCSAYSVHEVEQTLMKLNSHHLSLPSVQEWRRQHTSFVSRFQTVDKKARIDTVTQWLERIAQAKESERTFDHYDALQNMQQALLKAIYSGSLDEKEVTERRALIRSLNVELLTLQQEYQLVSPFRTESMRLLKENFFKPLLQDPGRAETVASGLSFTQDQEAFEAFYNQEYNEPLALSHFKMIYLGGGNNKNWRIVDLSGNSFVLRVEFQVNNHALINQLMHSSVQPYFVEDYFALHTDSTRSLIITDFIQGGDLRSLREKLTDEKMIVEHAIKDINELVELCQALQDNQAVHPDIKLSNFLKGGLIADKKAIMNTIGGNIDTGAVGSEIATTNIFAPPEFHAALKPYHAEKFMAYQLGLALYDYLVLPEVTENGPVWPQAMDFTHAIFSSSEGEKLAQLIQSLTIESPGDRMGLAQARTVLQDLLPKKAEGLVSAPVEKKPASTAVKSQLQAQIKEAMPQSLNVPVATSTTTLSSSGRK